MRIPWSTSYKPHWCLHRTNTKLCGEGTGEVTSWHWLHDPDGKQMETTWLRILSESFQWIQITRGQGPTPRSYGSAGLWCRNESLPGFPYVLMFLPQDPLSDTQSSSPPTQHTRDPSGRGGFIYLFIFYLKGKLNELYFKLSPEVKSLSCVLPFVTPMDSSLHQAPPPMGFSRQEYWSGLSFPSPRGGFRMGTSERGQG